MTMEIRMTTQSSEGGGSRMENGWQCHKQGAGYTVICDESHPHRSALRLDSADADKDNKKTISFLSKRTK